MRQRKVCPDCKRDVKATSLHWPLAAAVVRNFRAIEAWQPSNPGVPHHSERPAFS